MSASKADHSANHPSVRDVRAQFPEASRQRSTLRGLTLFLVSACLYTATLLAFVAVPSWSAKLLCVVLNGGFMAVLYFIAHDACHGSLTSHAWLNRLIGRLGFLPALHPYSFWLICHNYFHHGFTNLRGKDHVWAPLSWKEYAGLSVIRRGLERFYRTMLGVGFYYLIELWWKHLVCPRPADRERIHSRFTAVLDHLAVLLFVSGQIASLCAWRDYLARRFGVPPLPWQVLLGVGLLLPWLLLNWGGGLVTFLHHTHPRVRWFSDRKIWGFYQGQVCGTAHVTLPRPLEWILHNVMEHTAHHADPRVPLYHLRASQRRLEEAFPEVVVERLTLRQVRHTLSTCQLYDYDNYRWLDFRGRPTAGLGFPSPVLP